MSETVVDDWLRSIGLAHYAQSFIDNGYDDLDVCRQIGYPDLDAIGVLDSADRVVVLQAVGELIHQYDNDQRSAAAAAADSAGDGYSSTDGDGLTLAGGGSGTPVYFTLENPNYTRLLPHIQHQPASANAVDGPPSDGGQAVSSWCRTVTTNGFVGDASAPFDVALSSSSSVPDAELCTYPRSQLLALIRDRLVDDGVKLSEEPYTLENGVINERALKHLSLRYAGALNTRIREVLACIQELCVLSSSSENKSTAEEVSDGDMNCERTAYDMVSVCGQTFRRNTALQRQSAYYCMPPPSTLSCSADKLSSYSVVDVVHQITSTNSQRDDDDVSPSMNADADLDLTSSTLLLSDMSENSGASQKGSSSFSSLGRFLKNVALRKSTSRKYAYRQHDGDLNASEMTMAEEDRIQLMILVKEGKLTVQEAVETVKKYRQLTIDDENGEESMQLSTLQRKALSAVNSPVSSPSRQLPGSPQITSSSPKDRTKPSFISPLFLRKGHRKGSQDGDQSTRCAIPVSNRRRNDNVAAQSSSSAIPSRARRSRWSPPPLPPIPTGSGPIVESVSAEFSYCRGNGYQTSRLTDRGPSGEASPGADAISVAASSVRKSHSLHSSSSTALHHLMTASEARLPAANVTLVEDHHSDTVDDGDCDETVADQMRSPKRHTPPSGCTPESQVAKRQFVARESNASSTAAVSGETDVLSIGSNELTAAGMCVIMPIMPDQSPYDTLLCSDTFIQSASSERKLQSVQNGNTSTGDEYISSDYDSNADQRDFERTVVKDSSARDGTGVKLSDGFIRVHPSLLHDNRDRVHSSMDSLTNANSASACGISSSSSHSSMSVDEELSSRSSSLSRVRARCDSRMLSAEGGEALVFKKGDIIHLLSLSESGICRGLINNCVGSFHIADVEMLHEDGTLLASPRHGRPCKGRRGLRRPKPKTVEELLGRLGLQRLTALFITSGFTTLEEFSELDEADLDDLHVVHAEDRAKLLTAAQLLSDYENTSSDIGGQHDDNESSSRSTSQSPALSHDASCQTLSFVSPGRVGSCIECPTTFEYSPPPATGSRSDHESSEDKSFSSPKQKRHDVWPRTTESHNTKDSKATKSTSNGSSEEIHRSGFVRYGDARTLTNGDGRKQPLATAKQVTSPVECRSGSGGTLPVRSGSPSVRSAQVRQLVTGLPVATDRSTATCDARSRLPTTVTGGGGGVMETTTLPVLTRQHGQLVAAMLRLLAADKIDLTLPPYTHKVTGESGVPVSLIRQYADVLHSGRSEAVLAMEDCRQRALAASCLSRKHIGGTPCAAVAHALPTDCSSSDSICDFLSTLGLSTYAGDFAARGFVTVDQLRGLSAADLSEIGVNPGQHVTRLLAAVETTRTLPDRDRMSSSSSRPTYQSSGGTAVTSSRHGQVARHATRVGPAASRGDDGRAASTFIVVGHQRETTIGTTSTKIAKGPTAPVSKIMDRV